MNHDWQVNLPGCANLFPENGLLNVARRKVVVVVKSDLPDRASCGSRRNPLSGERTGT
jgi:hypothetical protein